MECQKTVAMLYRQRDDLALLRSGCRCRAGGPSVASHSGTGQVQTVGWLGQLAMQELLSISNLIVATESEILYN